MNAIVKITAEFNSHLVAIREAGKTPWVIINEDYAVGAYANRTIARETKAAENLEGKILKADEVEFELVSPITFEETPNAIQEVADKALEAKTHAAKPEITHESSIVRPCKRVWHIADNMLVTAPGAKRREVLAACVAEGIAYYTARTQYQQWLQVRKEMLEREAKQAVGK